MTLAINLYVITLDYGAYKFGRYVLLERLAFGGMAEVLLAFDTEAQDNQPIVL